MRVLLIITALIMALCLCGCEAVVPAFESTEAIATSLSPTMIAKAESTERPEAITPPNTETGEPSAVPSEQRGAELVVEKGEAADKKETKKIETVRPSSKRQETAAPLITGSPKPTPSNPSATRTRTASATATLTKAQPTATPAETRPKTAYDYAFDIDAIRADCIVIGESMGYTLNTSLNPQNATWWNPVAASRENQGNALKTDLERYIRFHTAANLTSYGMDEICEFNIYCAPRDDGTYVIYFVFE